MAEDYRDIARRRMHPKLRVLLNSGPSVLAAKAEVLGCLSVERSIADAVVPLSAAVTSAEASIRKTAIKDLDAGNRESKVKVSVFVQSVGFDMDGSDGRAMGRRAVKRISLEEAEALAADPKTMFVEPADSLKDPRPVRGNATPTLRSRRPLRSGRQQHKDGEGVLIGLIDVEGFDWAHPDLLDDNGNPRFIGLWDQGPSNGTPPKGFAYGHVIGPKEMQRALAEAKTIKVSPHDLEPQSQMLGGSHGTHVASIAAGRSGVCSKADIAAVLVSLPEGHLDRRTSFYDSTRLLDAVYYLLDLAGDRPVSINISLGTNGHAHDASSTLDRWLDALLAEPGRSICVAAGNAGQERPEAPEDLGFMLGRIHTEGRIAAQGLEHDVEWEVVGDRVIDASENELEIWYEPQDRFAISVRPPDGDWIGPIAPGEYLQNMQRPDRTLISIYNELHHPANGSNYIAVYLTPFMGAQVVGVAAGTWLVRLHGQVVRDGRFHGWIERDDPADLGDGTHYWPSYFSEGSHVDASTVSSLACGHRIISVANLDEAKRTVHITSSQGPTRDGRPKPDIAAPGTDIVAANGFGDADDLWIPMTGTSMASPHVAGVVGLMLAVEPRLTAAQIVGILKATAQPLPGGTFEWANDAGFGVIRPDACVRAASHLMEEHDVKGRFQ